MNLRENLAKLFSKYNLSLNDYAATSEAKEFIDRPDIIKKIAQYELPEVIKLICSSGELLDTEWGQKYKSVYPLYIDSSSSHLEKILNDIDNKELLSDYIPYMDKSMLQCIDSIFTSLQKDGSKYGKKKKNLESILKDCEKKDEQLAETLRKVEINAQRTDEGEENQKDIQSENDEDDKKLPSLKTIKGQITRNKNKREELITELNSLEKDADEKRRLFEKCLPVFEKVSDILKTYDSVIGDRRSQVYKIEAPLSKEELLIKCVINGEDLDSFKEELKNEFFCLRFLDELYKEYPEKYIHIIARLYDLGMIDIQEEPFRGNMKNHVSAVIDYTLQTQGSEDWEIWNQLTWSYIFESSLLSDYSNDLQPLLDTIDTAEKWNRVIDIIEKQYPDQKITLLCYLFLNTAGRPRHILQMIIEEHLFDEKSDASVSEFVNGLLSVNDRGDHLQIEYAETLVSKLENELHQTQRKKNMAQREVNGIDSMIFSAVYQPIEQLELLATNLKYPDKESPKIPYPMIIKHLMDNIAHLRAGLDDIGIHGVNDISDWQEQRSVSFDPTKHKFNGIRPKKNVKLRSLGFLYKDETGKESVYPANVMTDGPLKEEISNKSKSTNNYYKGKTSNRKTNHNKPLKGKKSQRKGKH